jgi:hypothetical protein
MVSQNLAQPADLRGLWRLPLRRGNSLREPEEPEIWSKSQTKSLWRKVATSTNDPFEKRHPDDFKFARTSCRSVQPSLNEPGLLLPCERLCLVALSGIFKREVVVCFWFVMG